MNNLKTKLFAGLLFCTCHFANAQITAGLYTNGVLSQVGIGSNPEKKFFGEGRLLAGDYLNRFLGIEAIGQYNFKRSEWHNISGGIMAGYDEMHDVRVGLPVLLTLKPIQNHRKLAIILEATPMYNNYFALRGNFGLKYTISAD